MKIDPKDFRVPSGDKVHLGKWPTDVKPLYESKKDYKKHLAADVKELSALQELLYASNRYAVLLIFQAMDAAGKDGTINHVLTGIHPQGCEVHSFKQPSAEELRHDFLWRTTCQLPAHGLIGVFNRSYYEEVLVVREHQELLRKEKISDKDVGGKTVWEGRYRSIVDLEEHLERNGTRVLKFFLHLSKDEQRKRFLARINEADKNWKFSPADFAERKFWDQYMELYEDCLSATSTKAAPWYVVPADDKHNARLIVSRIVIEAMESLDMHYPKVSRARRRALLSIRQQLMK